MTRTAPARRRRRSALATGAALPVIVLVGWLLLGAPTGAADAQAALDDLLERAGIGAPSPAAPATAGATLGDVVVAGGTAADTYDRDAFGDAWADVDRNGCDTRNDILARDLADAVHRNGSGCVISRGTLHDPYTGATISFERGQRSDRVQIDHVVALSYAWRHGASAWTDEQRRAFANDPANLLAVDGRTNQSKSDLGPSEWSPPDGSYRCAYHAGFVAMLAKYGLTIDPADASTIASDGCPATR